MLRAPFLLARTSFSLNRDSVRVSEGAAEDASWGFSDDDDDEAAAPPSVVFACDALRRNGRWCASSGAVFSRREGWTGLGGGGGNGDFSARLESVIDEEEDDAVALFLRMYPLRLLARTPWYLGSALGAICSVN